MKKMILTTCLLAGASVLQAQPTLNNAENFKIGDTLKYYTVDDPAISVSTGGANVTWNYSNIGSLIVDSFYEAIIVPGATPYASNFPQANIVESHSDGLMIFMETTASDNNVWGIFSQGSGLISYSNPYHFIRRPLTYQSSISDTSRRSYTVSSISFTGTGYSETTADGWGTLVLPNGTFPNAIRAVFRQSYFDTASSGTARNIIASYAWFDAGHKGALLKIDSVIINTPFFDDTTVEVSYLKEEINAVNISDASKELNGIEARVFDGNLYLSGNFENGEALTVDVVSLSGRKVKTFNPVAGNRQVVLPIGDLPRSVYIISIQSGKKAQRTTLKVSI